MPRRSAFVVLGAALLVGAVALDRAPGTTTAAQEGTPAATAGAGFVGAWRLTDVGFEFPSLGTFSADGNLVVSPLPTEPLAEGTPIEMLLLSGGHGVKERAAMGPTELTAVVARIFANAGRLVGGMGNAALRACYVREATLDLWLARPGLTEQERERERVLHQVLAALAREDAPILAEAA